ncbi:MAG TPA: O-antigen ligase family protein [Gaiellaceae bacterium]|nr:O-antigen ligase family protein [Gaiellaceae bacterium]
MEPPPAPTFGASRPGVLALAGLVGAALLGAAFHGDGSSVGGVLPVGGSAVVLLALYVLVVAVGRAAVPRLGRDGVALVAATLGLVAWTGLTVVWSIVPDRSWDAFNKTVAFAAFLGLGVVLGGVAGRAGARTGASLLAAFTAVVLGWGLLSKAVPALDSSGGRIARLSEPIGYWNAVALVADVALVLGLWLGTTRGHPTWARVAGGLLAYAAMLALLLTLSRTGVAAAVVVAVLWLLLARERVEGGLLLVAAGIPAAVVGGWALTRHGLADDGAAHAARVSDGRIFAGLALAGAGLVVALVVLGTRRGLADANRARIGRGLLAAVAVSAALAVAAFVVAVGNPVSWTRDQITQSKDCTEVANNADRLGSLNVNGRLCWWTEAWKVFRRHDPGGAGADSFEIARKRVRVDARTVTEPHSVPMQQLAEGGVGGLLLFLALAGSTAWACASAVRRLDGAERAAAVALVAAPAAYGLHALVDYNWDYLATTAPTMVAVGVLASAGRALGEPRRRVVLGVGAVLLVAAFLVSFSFPRLAERNVRSSTSALDAGDYRKAERLAKRARFFNPLSVDPLTSLAFVAERRGDRAEAERRYIQAVELQPENPETWYTLGIYEFQVLENMCAAYRFLNNAYTLDPAGNQWVKGGPLDVARDAVNHGACKS